MRWTKSSRFSSRRGGGGGGTGTGSGTENSQKKKKRRAEDGTRVRFRLFAFFFAHHETEKETDGGTHLSYGTVEAQHFVFGSILWCSFERKKNK